MVKHAEHLTDHEFHHIYCLKLDLAKEDFTLQTEEVSEVEWFGFQRIFTPETTIPEMVPFDREYLNLVAKHLYSKFL